MTAGQTQPRLDAIADRHGLEVLDRPECLDLLATRRLGRIGITLGALPSVLPVNYAVAPMGVVIRTGPGAKLDAAIHQQVVCFEVDDADPVSHSGWSVQVVGVARRVTDDLELETVRALPVPHWVRDDAEDFIVVPFELVSGRRLTTAARPSPAGGGTNGGQC